MKKVFSLSLLFCLGSTCGHSNPPDFDLLMGKGQKCWRSVKTKEDRRNLEIFRESFEKNWIKESPSNDPCIIPKKIHLIWLGPNPYPEKSKLFLKSFVLHHPDWEITLWSDRQREGLDPHVICQVIDSTYLGPFEELFNESTNLGEQSDLLRLVILQNEGGLYVDHDVVCRKPFTFLHQNYDFYTGLQNVGNHVIKSPAVVRNSIIGAVPGHPILAFALGLTQEKWRPAFIQYPGDDIASLMMRVTLRSFAAFHEAVLESIQDPSFSGIVFPAGYFNEIGGKFGLYSHEEMAGAWYRGEMTFYEKKLHEQVRKLMNRLNLSIAVIAALFIINFVLLAFLFVKKWLT